MTPEHEADNTRQVAWRVFVASLRDRSHRYGWYGILAALVETFDGIVSSGASADVSEFADLYGWPDTLRALAQAMDDDEHARRELMDRR